MSVSLDHRRRISQWLQRVPWMFAGMRFGLQVVQPRFTAGVVGVVMNREEKILLVEHVFHPQTPWGLPGGWLERGEAPILALQRELREETGIQVSICYPLLIETGYYYRTHLDIAFLCRAESDVSCLSSELLDYRWASLDDLPPMLPFHRAAILSSQYQRKPEV